MSEILAKISSYNIFNYLFPGAVAAVIATKLNIIVLPKFDIATTLIMYYFVGLTISRLGSVLLEPVLRWTKFVEYADYSTFLRASARDPKLEVMVEVSNTYRTLAVTFIFISVAAIGSSIANWIGLSIYMRNYCVVVALAVLFLLSFRKQVAYVARRTLYHGGQS